MNCLKPRAFEQRMKDLIRFEKEMQFDKHEFNFFMKMLAKQVKSMVAWNRANRFRSDKSSEDSGIEHISSPWKH